MPKLPPNGSTVRVSKGESGECSWGWCATGTVRGHNIDDTAFLIEYAPGNLMTNAGETEWVVPSEWPGYRCEVIRHA